MSPKRPAAKSRLGRPSPRNRPRSPIPDREPRVEPAAAQPATGVDDPIRARLTWLGGLDGAAPASSSLLDVLTRVNLGLGCTCVDAARLDDALAAFGAAIMLLRASAVSAAKDWLAAAYCLRGNVYELKRMPRQAREDYEQALGVSPGHPVARARCPDLSSSGTGAGLAPPSS